MTRDASDPCVAYERIAGLTAAMLEAARGAQWDTLLALETECRTVFAELVAAPAGGPLPPETVQRKAELIRQVLADDAEIRKLVEPWIAELGQWLGVSSRSQRLHSAYSAGH